MKKIILCVVVISVTSISHVMGMVQYVTCSDDDRSCSYSAIFREAGVRTATYCKEQNVYTAWLTRTILTRAGRFTFESQKLDNSHMVYEALKNMYEASKERDWQILHKAKDE